MHAAVFSPELRSERDYMQAPSCGNAQRTPRPDARQRSLSVQQFSFREIKKTDFYSPFGFCPNLTKMNYTLAAVAVNPGGGGGGSVKSQRSRVWRARCRADGRDAHSSQCRKQVGSVNAVALLSYYLALRLLAPVSFLSPPFLHNVTGTGRFPQPRDAIGWAEVKGRCSGWWISISWHPY